MSRLPALHRSLSLTTLVVVAAACGVNLGPAENADSQLSSAVPGAEVVVDEELEEVAESIGFGGLEDSKDLGPVPFDVAMGVKFLIEARDHLEGSWGSISNAQLLRTGTSYCEALTEGGNTTAAANAVALLTMDGVEIGLDASGRLDEQAEDLAVIVIVAAEDSLCTEFSPDVTTGTRPGVIEESMPSLADYLPAAAATTEYTSRYVPSIVRSRVPASAEHLYLDLIEGFSASVDRPITITEPEDQDRWLALGYTFCVASDNVGVGIGTAALVHDLGLPSEHATLVSFSATNYLCPEYLSVFR